MQKLNTEKRIQAFNDTNQPFYIVDLDDGKYSLCLPLDLLGNEFYPYCQAAFDAYAVEVGDPPVTERGLKTHGNGYEWEAAFHQAFEDDPNIHKILFDCEAGGFFCMADSLDLIEDFGRRFKEICEDTERFTPIVSEGIKKAEAWEKEKEQLMRTVKGRLMWRPNSSFEIMTPDGNIRLTPEDNRQLLSGEKQFVQIGGVIFSSYELLGQEVTDTQVDLFDSDLVRMKTAEAPEQELTPTMQEV